MALAVSIRPLLAFVLLCAIFVVSDGFSTNQQHCCNALQMMTDPRLNRQQHRHRWWSSTRLGASPSNVENRPKVLVKGRAQVSLDRETGKVTTIRRAPTPKTSNSFNPWNALKTTFYTATDAVTSFPSKINKKDEKKTVVDGYWAIEEKVAENKPSFQSPGQRLMNEYQARSTPTQSDSKRTASLFDGVKEGIYKTVDSLVSSGDDFDTKPLSPVNKFKTVVQPRLASSTEVKNALPNLNSASPGKRWLAELKIRNWEEEQRKRRRDFERKEAANAFKGFVYNVGDGIVDFTKSLTKLPETITKTSREVQTTAEATKQFVATGVETVASIPEQVDQTISKVQSTVETSIETTKKVVDDVQAIPSKIEQAVESTEKTVKELTTNVKILVGIEKKRPMPPPTPPPVETAEDLAWKVAASTAKAAWWVTGVIAKAGFAGAKLAYNKIEQKVQEQRMIATAETSNSKVASTSTAVKETTLAEPVAIKTAEPTTDMDTLDQEVKDALLLAETALKMAEEGTEADEKGMSDLDAALKRAREAAVKATQEAVDIERNLPKNE